MQYPIRHLGVGEVLDVSFAIMKDRLGVFLRISMILYLPLVLAIGWVNTYAMPEVPPDAGIEEWFAAYAEGSQKYMALRYLLAGLAGFVIGPITQGALIHASSRICLGRTVTVRESLQKGLATMLPLLVVNVLYGIAVFVGFFLIPIIGAIIAMLVFALVQPIVVLESENPVHAFARSRELMRKHLGSMFILSLVTLAVLLLLMTTPAVIPEPYTQTFFSSILQCAILALNTVVLVVFYISCRCRHDHFDLIQIAREISTAAEADGRTPATVAE